jgi:hypothetical protein
MCILNVSTNLSGSLLIIGRIQIDFSIKVLLSSCKVHGIFSDINQIRIFSTYFNEEPNTKFHENPSFGSQDIPRERKRRQERQAGRQAGRQNGRHRDTTDLTVAFRNFVNLH